MPRQVYYRQLTKSFPQFGGWGYSETGYETVYGLYTFTPTIMERLKHGQLKRNTKSRICEVGNNGFNLRCVYI